MNTVLESVSIAIQALSLIAIAVLLIERWEKRRPYLQVSYEPIRNSLACLVIRNVGQVPAQLMEFTCDDKFIQQLKDKTRNRIHILHRTNIVIHPGQKWVVSLDEITSTVMKMELQSVEVKMSYILPRKRRRYKEVTVIDFRHYAGYLIYISEIDELKREVIKMSDTMKSLLSGTNYKKSLSSTSSFEDSWERYIPTDQGK